MLTEFPIAGYHYFCETLDITRPYPSSHPPTEPSWEFVWNAYLTAPFRRIGLPTIAPNILQGLAEQRALSDFRGRGFDVVLFARRSRLHAGTRYKARGLNALSAPANEIECEQIVFAPSLSGVGAAVGAVGAGEKIKAGEVKWGSYIWRRGSVPLRWSQAVKSNGMGTAISIEAERTFCGSRRYRIVSTFCHICLLLFDCLASSQPGGRGVRASEKSHQGSTRTDIHLLLLAFDAHLHAFHLCAMHCTSFIAL
jgi:hypothetical protein